MDCIQFMQGNGTGAGFPECCIESKGRKFLDKFSDCLRSVELMYDRKLYCCRAIRSQYSSSCPSFPVSHHSCVAVIATATASKGSMFLQARKNPSVEDLVGDDIHISFSALKNEEIRRTVGSGVRFESCVEPSGRVVWKTRQWVYFCFDSDICCDLVVPFHGVPA
jgi:hypothetical protein